MPSSWVRIDIEGVAALGNAAFEMVVELTPERTPVMRSLRLAGRPDVNWAVPSQALGPELSIQGVSYSLGLGNMTFLRFLSAPDAVSGAELRLVYGLANGLEVTQHLAASSDKAVWRSWVTLRNTTANPIEGIARFDAANVALAVGQAPPQCRYVLGWLFGPRADAPGKPPIYHRYPSWLPRLLYGEDVPLAPPAPAGGWTTSILRPVSETLTYLPLRSGKRSTYDDHPWVAVLDPELQAGFFAGFCWSGTWAMDVRHDPAVRAVLLNAYSDGCVHTLAPGATLESPPAFVGLFEGDWDDASNATRRYIGSEIMPRLPAKFPTVHYCALRVMSEYSDAVLRREIDAAAEAGVESFLVDATWWEGSRADTDFSVGLGCFEANRTRFPQGLKPISDHAHRNGLRFGLWFEFERVDIRTANVGRHPWKPDWVVQQRGYPYRSWCQHVFCLCLGVPEAADWALENVSWAIREYGVDWIKLDSNEWAVCDDPAHGHGAQDGEWAQIHGLYRVMQGLRERFPDLIIEGPGGGAQRNDPGMARYCNTVICSDVPFPSSLMRQYSYGNGCIYPTYYALTSLDLAPHYPTWASCTPQEIERRALSRMMGVFSMDHVSGFQGENLATLKRATALYKRLRPTLHGDRYVLSAPTQLVAPEHREAGDWQAFEYLSPGADMASLFFFRCESPASEHHVCLRGLRRDAVYRVELFSGAPARSYRGAELMEAGYTCTLGNRRGAEIVLLTAQA